MLLLMMNSVRASPTPALGIADNVNARLGIADDEHESACASRGSTPHRSGRPRRRACRRRRALPLPRRSRRSPRRRRAASSSRARCRRCTAGRTRARRSPRARCGRPCSVTIAATRRMTGSQSGSVISRHEHLARLARCPVRSPTRTTRTRPAPIRSPTAWPDEDRRAGRARSGGRPLGGRACASWRSGRFRGAPARSTSSPVTPSLAPTRCPSAADDRQAGSSGPRSDRPIAPASARRRR